MNDTNDTAKKDTLKVANPGRLQLTKTVESGKVKQNFTHGRSKSVTVEVRKTRTFAQGVSGGGMVEVKQGSTGFANSPFSSSADDESMRHLTQEERQVRLNALKLAEEQMKVEAVLAEQRRAEEKHQRALRGEDSKPEREETKIVESIASPSGIVTPRKSEPAIVE
ncbi:MAG: translation initiation factor IF-2 associated domain-containing protein, partial [Rickettsiales bacterium]